MSERDQKAMAQLWTGRTKKPRTQPVKVTKADGSVTYITSAIPGKVQRQVFARDGLKCRYCRYNKPDGDYHIDHVIPVSKGGTIELSNLVVACRRCNRLKATKVWVVGLPPWRQPLEVRPKKMMSRGQRRRLREGERARLLVSVEHTVYHRPVMAKVSSGRAFPQRPRGTAEWTGDPAIIAQGLAGNRAHNTYASESEYDRTGELGSFRRKASGLHAADFDDDCLTDGIDWERD